MVRRADAGAAARVHGLSGRVKRQPEALHYEGNQYVQYGGYPFLLLNEEQRRYYSDEAEYAVRELLDDQTGSVTTLRSAKWDNSLDW